MLVSRKLVKAIKEYILDSKDSKEEAIAEVKRYKKEFPMVLDYNWYEYGNILPYYSQIRSFYNENGFYPEDNDSVLEEHFRQHIKYAIDEIIAEN